MNRHLHRFGITSVALFWCAVLFGLWLTEGRGAENDGGNYLEASRRFADTVVETDNRGVAAVADDIRGRLSGG